MALSLSLRGSAMRRVAPSRGRIGTIVLERKCGGRIAHHDAAAALVVEHAGGGPGGSDRVAAVSKEDAVTAIRADGARAGLRLSVVVPVYNERYLVGELIRRVLAVPTRASRGLDLIVVDDGSTDGTARSSAHRRRRAGPRAPIRAPAEPGQGGGDPHRHRRGRRRPDRLPGRRPRVRPAATTRAWSGRFWTTAPTSSTARGSSPRRRRRVLYFRHALGNRLLTLLSNSSPTST